MNVANENQHWISRCLLKRFKAKGEPFQCFQIGSGDWKPRSLDSVCSAPGYNQLVIEGKADNQLDNAFCGLESKLPKVLSALDAVSQNSTTELPQPLYENLCWYLSFLKGTAPYSKPGAVVSFLFQLNMELENGGDSLLRDLSIPEETIQELRRQCSLGRKVIIESENLIQLVYRFQFRRNYQYDFTRFLHTKWVVSSSHLELPIPDVGMVPVYIESHKANHYLLPVRPDLLLEGISFHEAAKNSSAPILKHLRLTNEEALYRFELICASAMSEIVCRSKLSGIPEARERAKAHGTQFGRITNPKSVASAGRIDVGRGDFVFRVVSVEDYVKAVHAHVLPGN